MKNNKIVGIFSSETEAISVIENLKRSGYKDNEISVVAKDRDKLDRIDDVADIDTNTSATDTSSAVGGAVVGGALGGIGALLVEFGVLAIPGVGPFLAAGPIAVTLAGLIAGGAVGGIVGALVDSGIDEEDAREYEGFIERGDILIAVDEKADLDRDNVIRYYSENNSVIRDRYNNY